MPYSLISGVVALVFVVCNESLTSLLKVHVDVIKQSNRGVKSREMTS